MRKPYPNELYHHGVKGMKWGRRKVQQQDGTHPTSSGSLHKVGSGLGSGPVGSGSDRKAITTTAPRRLDGKAALQKYKAAVQIAMNNNLYFDAGPCFVAQVGERQGVPRAFVLTTDDGSDIYGLYSTKEAALKAASKLHSDREKRKRKLKRETNKKGVIAAQGILDGMSRAGTSGGR